MKLTLLMVALVLIACNSSRKLDSNTRTIESKDSISQSQTEKMTSASSFETDDNCVIFLMPSDAEIKKMQKGNTEEDYNEIIADLTWYSGVASEYLDSLGIKSKIIDNQIYLILKRINGESIKLKKNKIEGDMVLFRKDTLPIIGHAIEFDRDFIKKFFRKIITANRVTRPASKS